MMMVVVVFGVTIVPIVMVHFGTAAPSSSPTVHLTTIATARTTVFMTPTIVATLAMESTFTRDDIDLQKCPILRHNSTLSRGWESAFRLIGYMVTEIASVTKNGCVGGCRVDDHCFCCWLPAGLDGDCCFRIGRDFECLEYEYGLPHEITIMDKSMHA